MTRSDTFFFSVMFGGLAIVLISIGFGLEIPEWFNFWWVVLLPPAMVRIFFPNSKFVKWFFINKKNKK